MRLGQGMPRWPMPGGSLACVTLLRVPGAPRALSSHLLFSEDGREGHWKSRSLAFRTQNPRGGEWVFVCAWPSAQTEAPPSLGPDAV